MPKDNTPTDITQSTCWGRATLERNWLIFTVDAPHPVTGKRLKRPTRKISSEYENERQAYGDRVCAVEDAATHTFDEIRAIHAALDPDGFAIGYLARDGSAMVMADMDRCRDPVSGALDQWAQDILALSPTYAEVSTSQTGIRVLMERQDGDVLISKGERNDVGIFANNTQGAVITLNPLSGRALDVVAAPALRDAILARRGTDDGPRKSAQYEGAAVERDLLRAVTMAIPNVGLVYDQWVDLGYAIKFHDDTDIGRDLFLEWSAQYVGEQTQKPEKIWDGLAPNGSIGFGTLIQMARDGNGGQLPGGLEARMVQRRIDTITANMPMSALPAGVVAWSPDVAARQKAKEKAAQEERIQVSVAAGFVLDGKSEQVCNAANIHTLLSQHDIWNQCFAYDVMAERPVLLMAMPNTHEPKLPRDLVDEDFLKVRKWVQLMPYYAKAASLGDR